MPLPKDDRNSTPKDEKTREFIEALEQMEVEDEGYKKEMKELSDRIEKYEIENVEAEDERRRIDISLREKVRKSLGMPDRKEYTERYKKIRRKERNKPRP